MNPSNRNLVQNSEDPSDVIEAFALPIATPRLVNEYKEYSGVAGSERKNKKAGQKNASRPAKDGPTNNSKRPPDHSGDAETLTSDLELYSTIPQPIFVRR